jgi:CheY-like chemotaxis protein
MPVKILLADKSITIQKVVEMLFSGKEYEVLSVSDGETALSEAERVIPDVVLADVDLPRIDGYSFAARLKGNAALAKTPVILMMSRDDVLNDEKAREASIVDHIAKPFESQELIGKIKKAISASPSRSAAAEPAPPRPAAPPQRPAAPIVSAAPVQKPPAAPPKAAAKPKPAAPSDIFDIIQEAPSQADLKRPAASPPPPEEDVFEVEPVIEVEESEPESDQVLPRGEKALEEMRAGLGLGGTADQPEPDIVNFESLDMANASAQEYAPPQPKAQPRRAVPESFVPREYVPPPAEPEVAPPGQMPRVSEEMVRRGIEEAVAKIAREMAREVIEKVAWEVVPELAEMLIKAEIERLKGEQ